MSCEIKVRLLPEDLIKVKIDGTMLRNEILLQDKTAIPSIEQQNIVADPGYTALRQVIVEPLPILEGSAEPNFVVEGKTFYSNSYEKQEGTMTNNGDSNAVKYTPQSLTSAQQEQARTNISAPELDSLGRVLNPSLKQQIDCNATIINGVIVAEISDPTLVDLVSNVEYEFDILLSVASITGSLNYSLPMVITQNGNNIVINNILNPNSSENVLFGQMQDIVQYNQETGFRWIFDATYNEVVNGDITTRTVNIAPTVSKTDNGVLTLDNNIMLDSITSSDILYGIFKVGQIATPTDDDGFSLGSLYQYTRSGSGTTESPYIYNWNLISKAIFTSLEQTGYAEPSGTFYPEAFASYCTNFPSNSTLKITQVNSTTYPKLFAFLDESAFLGNADQMISILYDGISTTYIIGCAFNIRLHNQEYGEYTYKTSENADYGNWVQTYPTPYTLVTTESTNGNKTVVGINDSEWYYTNASGLTSLALGGVLPPSPIEPFNFSVAFKSGNIATTFTNTLGAFFIGQDCNGGVFTPIENTTYQISVWYNQIGWFGSVVRLG